MRALLVHCHPSAESFSAAVRDAAREKLRAGGWEIEEIDLYADGFDPVLTRDAWERYERAPENLEGVEEHVAALRRADALVFVYPTWWYGHPALLKGWLDRVLVPEVAFTLPEGGPIRPALTNIRDIAVLTTCGASRWITWLVGAPGRRTLTRGLRMVCHPRARTWFAAHYLMDASTPDSRARHLVRVARLIDRMTARRRRGG